MHLYKLEFSLNEQQNIVSNKIVGYYMKNKDIILEAVCGAGKTEMLLAVISLGLKEGKNIGFACPRRQLTIELYERVDEYFYNHQNIGLVVGGQRINELSNLIFLTTHQLINYKNYFDLLIIDEVDAFPYFNNIKLEQAAQESSKQFIYLSATMPQKYLVNANLVKVTNYKRHHLKIMPIPKIVLVRYGLMMIKLLIIIIRLKNDPLIVFVPNKRDGNKLNKLFKLLGFKSKFVYSKTLNTKVINDFRSQTIKILISTTVLERGITLKGLNVIVFRADCSIFNSDVLIQICGRVGRSTEQPNGKLYFLAYKESDAMKKCTIKLENYNEM
ncbi:MAG: helicase-related protein [Erysipelotrichales bacterium]